MFAPEAADEVVEHLETLINDMANDKLPAWFMKATQAAEVIAIVKKGSKIDANSSAEHRQQAGGQGSVGAVS